MVTTLMSTMLLLVTLMAGWILVQRAARRQAEEYPELGPLRLVGGGCGGGGHGHDHVDEPGSSLSERAPAPDTEGCNACSNAACKAVILANSAPPPAALDLRPSPAQ
jgi:hypothetical protein